MGLDLNKIRQIITEPKKKKAIQRAILHQNWIKFHAQTEITPDFSQPLNNFFAFVKNLLPHDKYQMFKTLFRYPVKTNEITGICFDKLSRIFEGRNPAYNYQFKQNNDREDWEEYRLKVLREPEVWNTKGWEFFKTEINSVLVVDLPQVQTGNLPEPYFYWVTIDSVIDYDFDPTTNVMYWLIFRRDKNHIVVIDDERYRVFVVKDEKIGEPIVDNVHDLGYCPARFFWSDPINLTEPDVKQSPLTKELESLDWFLFYHVSKRNLDVSGSYPIYSGYEQSCDFSNEENGDYCDGGFLKNKQGYYLFDNAGVLVPCPKCGKKRIIGPGSFVEVPVPTEGQPDLKNPVQMLTVDRNSLDYNVAEEERLRNAIITSIVGTNEEITTRDALNEQQIRANFESQSTVLNRVKKGFELAQQFVDETACRLRYGKTFISAKVNLGTEFYIYDINDLRNRYKTAKESGASESELDALQTKIIETEYRNNPTELQRMLILAELEPYRHLTREEVIALFKDKIVSETDLRIKLNIANFVRRFERENMNILEFGSGTNFNNKINSIYQKLKDYASENKAGN